MQRNISTGSVISHELYLKTTNMTYFYYKNTRSQDNLKEHNFGRINGCVLLAFERLRKRHDPIRWFELCTGRTHYLGTPVYTCLRLDSFSLFSYLQLGVIFISAMLTLYK